MSSSLGSNAGRGGLSERTRRALALSVATVLTLGGGELGLRLSRHNTYRDEAPDHLVKLSMPHPRTDRLFSRAAIAPEDPSGRLRTDDRSYILPSFQHDSPDATIAFLGGSTTESFAVAEEVRFHALVSDLLAEEGLRVNTLNVARSGNTLQHSLNVLINHVVEDRPDFVVVMHAANDVGHLQTMGSYVAGMGHPVSIRDVAAWTLQMASSKLWLAALLRDYVSAPRITSPENPGEDGRHNQPPLEATVVAEYRWRLAAFIALCRAFDIQPVLMTQPFSGSRNQLTPDWVDNNAQDQFNSIIREIGQRESVIVIDLVQHLQEQVPNWDQPMEVFYDAIHVTDRGSRIYAEHIAEGLLPAIREQQALQDPSG